MDKLKKVMTVIGFMELIGLIILYALTFQGFDAEQIIVIGPIFLLAIPTFVIAIISLMFDPEMRESQKGNFGRSINYKLLLKGIPPLGILIMILSFAFFLGNTILQRFIQPEQTELLTAAAESRELPAMFIGFVGVSLGILMRRNKEA